MNSTSYTKHSNLSLKYFLKDQIRLLTPYLVFTRFWNQWPKIATPYAARNLRTSRVKIPIPRVSNVSEDVPYKR